MDAYDLKLKLEKKAMKHAAGIPLSPNAITLLSFITMVIAGYYVVSGQLLVAGLVVILSGLLDVLDGTVAKARKKATRFGAFLDRVADRASDMVIVSAIIFAGYSTILLGLFTLSVMFLASYASACLESMTRSRVGERLSLRAVRLAVIAAGCLAGQLYASVILVALLSLYAVASRMSAARKLLS